MEDGSDGIPTVTVLILGEPGVGKSTFLSRLTNGEHVTPPPPSRPPRFSPSSMSLKTNDTPPPPFASSSSLPPPYAPASPLQPLPDAAQPVIIHLTLRQRPYRLRFFDISSPTPFTTLKPDVLILAFDVSRRKTLHALRSRWLKLVDATPGLNAYEQAAVLVLGLRRDRRGCESYRDDAPEGGSGGEDGGSGCVGVDEGGGSVTPHEALAIAQAMRCDRYAECSALTGELCGLVIEDIAKMAAASVEERGGRTQGGCAVM